MQVDTLDVRPLPDVVVKHFTGRDVVSRWDVGEAHRRATEPVWNLVSQPQVVM